MKNQQAPTHRCWPGPTSPNPPPACTLAGARSHETVPSPGHAVPTAAQSPADVCKYLPRPRDPTAGIARAGPRQPAEGGQSGPGHGLRPVTPPRIYLTGRSRGRLRRHTNTTHQRRKRRGRDNSAAAGAGSSSEVGFFFLALYFFARDWLLDGLGGGARVIRGPCWVCFLVGFLFWGFFGGGWAPVPQCSARILGPGAGILRLLVLLGFFASCFDLVCGYFC
jgi:hypothetical protein